MFSIQFSPTNKGIGRAQGYCQAVGLRFDPKTIETETINQQDKDGRNRPTYLKFVKNN